MPGTTPRYAFRYPVNADATNVAVDLQNAVTDVDTVLFAYRKTFRQSYTYAIAGPVSNVLLPEYELGLAAGETKTVTKLVFKLSSGTIDAQPLLNGANLGALLEVTSTRQAVTLSQAIANNDRLTITLSDGAGSPSDLSFVFQVDETA